MAKASHAQGKLIHSMNMMDNLMQQRLSKSPLIRGWRFGILNLYLTYIDERTKQKTGQSFNAVGSVGAAVSLN
jgi:hypothetical protein